MELIDRTNPAHQVTIKPEPRGRCTGWICICNVCGPLTPGYYLKANAVHAAMLHGKYVGSGRQSA